MQCCPAGPGSSAEEQMYGTMIGVLLRALHKGEEKSTGIAHASGEYLEYGLRAT